MWTIIVMINQAINMYIIILILEDDPGRRPLSHFCYGFPRVLEPAEGGVGKLASWCVD